MKCDQGVADILFRAFVRPDQPLTFQLDLSGSRERGRVPAMDRIVRSAYLGVDPSAAER